MAYGIILLGRCDLKIQNRVVGTTFLTVLRRCRVTTSAHDVATSVPSRHLALTLLVMVLLGPAGCADSTAHDEGQDHTQRVHLGGRDFELELALDAAARYQGLSDRREIAAEGGMLFVFPSPSNLQFVMRRCLLPIDLIYLDPAGRVLALYRMKVEAYDTPESRLIRYTSPWPAQFAIELRGGTLDTLGLKEGQRIDLSLDHLKRLAR